MPSLSTYLQQQGLAPESGTPRGGGVQVPVVPQPGADVAGQTAGAEGRLAFAASETRQADLLLQMDVLKAQQQKAQDVLDSKLQQHLFQQDVQSRWNEERQNPEYATLTERTMVAGKSLMDEHLKRLKSPQAQALFRENAEQYITLVQQKTFGEQQSRRDNATKFMLLQTAQGYIKQYSQAVNETERLAAQNELEKTLYQAVTTGLIDGAQASETLAKTEHSALVASSQIAIQADPDGMRRHLMDLGAGGQGNPAFPVPPRDSLAPLLQQAGELQRQRIAEISNTESWTQRRVEQLQDQAAGNRRAEVLQIELQPQNVPQLQDQLAKAQEDWARGALKKSDYENLTTFITTQIEKAKSPPPRRDDQPTEDRARLMISLSRLPGDFQATRNYLIESQRRLSAETFTTLNRDLDTREKGSLYFNRDTYQQGLDLIAPGAFAKGSILFPQLAKEEQHHNYRTAFEVYNAWYKNTLEKEGPEAVDERYYDKALTIRRELLDVPASSTAQLPKVLLLPDQRTLDPDPGSVTRKLESLGLDDKTKMHYYDQWRQKKIQLYEQQEPRTRLKGFEQAPQQQSGQQQGGSTTYGGVGVRN